jgi:hypothetical protein
MRKKSRRGLQTLWPSRRYPRTLRTGYALGGAIPLFKLLATIFAIFAQQMPSATSASLRSFERLRSSLPEAVQQPDTYSPDPATRRPSWGAPLPSCRSLRARHPLAFHYLVIREVVQLIARDHTKRKRDGSKAKSSSLPTVLEVCCTDRFTRPIMTVCLPTAEHYPTRRAYGREGCAPLA